MARDDVRFSLQDAVARIDLDDGKANALSASVIESLHRAFDEAEKEATAVVIAGREGRFCGGFDLETMGKGPAAVRSLVRDGADLLLRMFEYPLPVVAACTGHAVAAGALLLLAADARVGARGRFRIGLNEVSINMALPMFAIELARERLSKRHFVRATTQAELYDPEAAVDAGYLDRVTEPGAVCDAAVAEATRLGHLSQPAFRVSKRSAHARVIAYVRETLDANLESITGRPAR
jgi:enoyl-CoA hydratase